MTPYEKLSFTGSLSSIAGLFVSLYVLWREYIIGNDVENLKKEEETWHEKESQCSIQNKA